MTANPVICGVLPVLKKTNIIDLILNTKYLITQFSKELYMAGRILDPEDDDLENFLFYLGIAVFFLVFTILYLVKTYYQ